MSANTDIYDEEFRQHLILAKTLIARVRDKADRKICSKWIQRLCNLHSDDVTVKRNRNSFFKYMLQVLKSGITSAESPQQSKPPCSTCTVTSNYDPYGEGDLVQLQNEKNRSFMSHWSLDRRTYVACKTIPGRGALIYMAVCQDPTLGWEIPGKKKNK